MRTCAYRKLIVLASGLTMLAVGCGTTNWLDLTIALVGVLPSVLQIIAGSLPQTTTTAVPTA